MFKLRRIIPMVLRFTASLSRLAPLSTVPPSKTIVPYQIVVKPITTSTTVWKKKEVIDGLPTEDEKKTVKQSGGSTGPKNTNVSKISLLSWNIDGFCGWRRSMRMQEVSENISRMKPDFVFLQEVSELDIDKLLLLENFYNIHFSNRNSKHFTAILVKKEFSVLNNEVIPFKNSIKARTLHIIEGKYGPFHVFLLNTHLESGIFYAMIRQQQLKQCFTKIDSISKEYPNALIFYGGDLNLRDEEIGALPIEFGDAWQEAGAHKKRKITWDSVKNRNKNCSHGGRCRFDRIIYKINPVIKVTFELRGKQIIPEGNCYPSDHWAIHSTFSVRCDPKNKK